MKWNNTVISDIDGTLALLNGRDPYDASKCENDLPNEPVVNLLKLLEDQGDPVIIVSGRMEKDRIPTEKWLEQQGIFYDKFFMRQTDDVRKDSIVKREIYEEFIEPFYDIWFVLDDRQQVVDLWRSLGLTCLQVNPGPPPKRK